MAHLKRPLIYITLLLLGGGLLSPLISYATLTLDSTSLTSDGALTLKSASSSATTLGHADQSGTITIASTTQALTVDIGKSTAILTLTLGGGTGGHTINVGNGTGTAKTINIGTGASTTNTIIIGSSSSTVGVGTSNPHSSAILHVSSTSKGFLPPVVTTAQRDAISSPATGLIVFNSSSSTLQVYDGGGWRGLATSTELVYKEFTSSVSIANSTEASATAVVTADAFTFDGNTTVEIEFFAPAVQPAATGDSIVFYLYEDGASIGRLGDFTSPTDETSFAALLKQRLTPASGSRTYSIRARKSTSNGSVVGGAGGSGNYRPGYIRITKVLR